MFEVDINKIIPVTEARANISALVNEVEKGHTYVLTRGGKPVVALVPASQLSQKQNQPKSLFKPVKKISPPSVKSAITQHAITEQTNEEDVPSLDLDKVNQALAQYEQNSL